jgi:hypothetical protein
MASVARKSVLLLVDQDTKTPSIVCSLCSLLLGRRLASAGHWPLGSQAQWPVIASIRRGEDRGWQSDPQMEGGSGAA